MKSAKLYKDKDKLKAYKKRERIRYYHSGDFIEDKSRHLRYTEDEDRVIMLSDETDREIAKAFNRSIKSIQLRRHRLKNGLVLNRDYVNTIVNKG